MLFLSVSPVKWMLWGQSGSTAFRQNLATQQSNKFHLYNRHIYKSKKLLEPEALKGVTQLNDDKAHDEVVQSHSPSEAKQSLVQH